MPFAVRGFHTDRNVAGDEQYGYDAPAWSQFHVDLAALGGDGVMAGSVSVTGTRTLVVTGLRAVMAGLHVTGDHTYNVDTGRSQGQFVLTADWTARTVALGMISPTESLDQRPGVRYQIPLRLMDTGGASQITTSHLTNVAPRRRETHQGSAGITVPSLIGGAVIVLASLTLPDYGWPFAVNASGPFRVNADSNTSGRCYGYIQLRNMRNNTIAYTGTRFMSPNLTSGSIHQIDARALTPQLSGPHRVELVCSNEAPARIYISGGSGPLEVHVTAA